MANFDLDDPLADLLSDGSNDSFFEEPKVSVKKLSLTKTPEKKTVTELFGIDKSDIKQPNTSADWLGLLKDKKEVPEKTQSLFSPKKLTKKISFENDNVLSSFEVKTSKQDITNDTPKKVSLTESILKPTAEKTISFDEVSKPNTLFKKPEMNVQPHEKPIKKTENLQQKPFVSDSHREGRRPHQVQTGFTDFLGILSTETSRDTESDIKKLASPIKKSDNTKNVKRILNSPHTDTIQTEVLFPAPGNRDMKTKSVPNIGLLPNWLDSAGSLMETQKSDVNLPPPVESEGTIINNKEDASEVTIPQQDIQTIDKQHSDNFLLHSLVSQQKLAVSEVEYQNTTFAMQQQNSQLIMALQLKKYEENLAVMQRKQQEILSKQEKQFNRLLERQLTKQQIMENNMRMQQERINSHMQMLLSQSSIDGGALVEEDFDNIQDLKKSTFNQTTQLLEELLNSFKQKSQEEKCLLEDSHKKQISTLEQTMESIENRLKTEIDHLHENYQGKYDQLKESYDKEIKKYQEKIEEMSMHQSNELRSIRESHDKVIEEIKYEYSTLIESIKQTKQSETTLFQNSSEYSQKLDSNIKILDMNTKLLVGVRDKVENDYGILTVAREESLKVKEEEIKLMKNSLEKVRASAETERSQLLALVRSLEIKLTEQTQNAREERWAMQQAASTLAARTAALDREAEFGRAALEREREQLKTLKETLLAEQENKTLQLTEEKLALSAERSRLETSAKLFQNYDSQRSKAEIDAAIEVAKKAAEMTDTERKNLHRLQCEVENLKRTLLDREHKLTIKEKELEAMMQIADRKSKDGEQAIVRANATQRDYNERLKDIQNQLVSLSSRERKLAEEKISLSKERLSLQGQIRQLKHPTSYMFDVQPQIEDYDYPESV